jgi:multiple sugar transport system substrate-binding protein
MTDPQGASRRRFLQAGGAALAAILAGCPGDSGERTPVESATQTPTDPVFMLTDYHTERWIDLWNGQLIPAFKEETLLRVRVGSPPRPDSGRRLRTLVRSGEPPDVHTATPARMADLENQYGRVRAPVTDVVERATERNGDLVVPPPEYPDRLQVPHGHQALTLLYREDVYDELGLDVPTSFGELLDNARAIDRSDLDIRGYALAEREKRRDEVQAYLAQAGVPPAGLRHRDPDGEELEIHFPEETVTAVLELLAGLAAFSPRPEGGEGTAGLGWEGSVGAWVEGQVAQQVHWNNFPAGVAAANARGDDPIEGAGAVAENTGVAPLPYWEAGGVGPEEGRLGRPRTDAQFLFRNGDRTAGGRRWLRWLYADDPSRTASLYRPRPTRFVPAYGDVLSAESFRKTGLFQEFPGLLDQLEYVRETVIADHYDPAAAVDRPVALSVGRREFFGEMLSRVLAGTDSVPEAYEYGKILLETRFEDAHEQF